MGHELVVVIDCADLDRATAFWTGVLGYAPGGAAGPYRALLPPTRSGTEVLLQRTSDLKVGKNRVHLDLRVASVDAMEAEVVRVRELGAALVAGPLLEDGWRWYVLADPDGNEFCILAPPQP